MRIENANVVLFVKRRYKLFVIYECVARMMPTIMVLGRRMIAWSFTPNKEPYLRRGRGSKFSDAEVSKIIKR